MNLLSQSPKPGHGISHDLKIILFDVGCLSRNPLNRVMVFHTEEEDPPIVVDPPVSQSPKPGHGISHYGHDDSGVFSLSMSQSPKPELSRK